jgi:lysyl-tRNA synthetase class 2
VGEAFQRYAGWGEGEAIDAAANDEVRFWRALVERVEPALERLDRAIFLVDYPASQASLARKKPGDPRLAERFELYVAGVELCNGFGELVDPVEQRTRFERDQALRQERGLPAYPIDERFLEALARVPPSAGNALGLDRLVALACGMTAIADVIAFLADEL